MQKLFSYSIFIAFSLQTVELVFSHTPFWAPIQKISVWRWLRGFTRKIEPLKCCCGMSFTVIMIFFFHQIRYVPIDWTCQVTRTMYHFQNICKISVSTEIHFIHRWFHSWKSSANYQESAVQVYLIFAGNCCINAFNFGVCKLSSTCVVEVATDLKSGVSCEMI